ncbi:MAG: ABC transporter permease, partial [Planctomycetota bacterium]
MQSVASDPSTPVDLAPAAPASSSSIALTPVTVKKLGPVALRLVGLCETAGLSWFIPLINIVNGVTPRYHGKELARMIGLPFLAMLMVLGAWHITAKNITLNEKEVPTPGIVAERLVDFFYHQPLAQVDARVAYEAEMLDMVDGDQAALAEMLLEYPFEAEATIYSKIWSSLVTVFTGFVIASIIAVPLGIVSGLSQRFYEAINPIIQILKPISPIAWLPIFYAVLLAVKAQQFDAVGRELPVDFAYLVAAVVVAVCSLWPTLLNTANGVANVDRDFLNVSRVLNHGALTKVWRVILPASLPMI